MILTNTPLFIRVLINSAIVALVYFTCHMLAFNTLLTSGVIFFCAIVTSYLLFNDTNIKSLSLAQNSPVENIATATIGKSIDEQTSKLAISAAEISFFLEQLTHAIEQSSLDVNNLANSAELLSSNTKQINDNALHASEKAALAMQETTIGSKQLANNVNTIGALNQGVMDASDKIQSLSNKTAKIQSITNVIDAISAQTNLLALNAAIEAARAGEQGRGFAVVADEVRALASKTAEATRQIGSMLTEVNEETEATTEVMQTVVEQTHTIVESISELSQALQQVSQLIADTSNASNLISNTLKEHDLTTEEISSAIANLHHFLVSKSEQTQEISLKADHLSQTTESIFINLAEFKTNSLNDIMCQKAIKTAHEIGALFEKKINDKEISTQKLFDFTYHEIANTNPKKYNTSFDAFTDKVLPAIQEKILTDHNAVIYAGAVDINGYFPTHNQCFSQPLTGNYDVDVVNNRTKRLFNDATGIRCAKNTQKFLLQTYKRDTGEIMHDVSAPIYVNGQHWGGFRMGFKAN
ncbi:methyl-accepting chemotaxis protein [Thalassotalea profundi]|uniref:Methyl-accepting chemotaxis protein n=1 Tax=Thalassotalea profundi TaxID=2036687 RepID=A0ABQ3IMZ0_9GAMM|nr:methyl-accepting chemotaxis protein [Thalassotalea profundi]GHE89122.1 methyl-accepting chemotaxis protein [Thalassotalea profundi]